MKYRNITIEWSYPVEVNSILQRDAMKDIGIYCISRKFKEQECILYIGKTTYSFGSRLYSHNRDWLNTYRGKKLVRLGRIVSPKKISEEERKELINDAEKTLIYYISNIEEYSLAANIASTKSTALNTVLRITNTGYRGHLPRELHIPEGMLTNV